MAEQQLDWVRLEDNRAALAHLLRASVERIGIVEVANHLGETPSALRNQVAGRRGMPPGTFALCFLLDEQFRRDACGLCGEVVTRPADLTPDEVVRMLAVEAQVKGFIPRERVAELLQRMKQPELRAVTP